MDGIETIIYIILFIIFIISRVIRGMKKTGENEEPAHDPWQSPPERKVEPQKTHAPEKSVREIAKRMRQKPVKTLERKKEDHVFPENSLDKIEMEEGVSSLKKEMKQIFEQPAETKERGFQFDPREAFMMKTLLERPYQ